jgi:Uma2 family endonuclease
MSSVPVRRQATYADLLALPDDVIGQIVDGDLYSMPRPAIPHQLTSSNLGGELDAPFRKGRGGPGGWWFLDEPELHLGRHVLVPDLAGWRRERVPSLPPDPYLTITPDWVCEVLSPSTARLDRIKKLRIYAEEAVGHAWLVDPALETWKTSAARTRGGLSSSRPAATTS